MKKFLQGKKTYMMAGFMWLHGLVMFLSGDQTFMEFAAGSQEFYEMALSMLAMTTRAAID